MLGLSHGGSFKETSVFSGRPCPLRARPPLPMGEMQGALARARLESLLRPRHKKRAEAQKRSESFLLTGLGKRRCRHAGGLSHQLLHQLLGLGERGWVFGVVPRMERWGRGRRAAGTRGRAGRSGPTLGPEIRACGAALPRRCRPAPER